jgi:hypothetical protein
LERHVFDGHEALYLQAFLGEPWEASTRTLPTLAWLYGLLGLLSSHAGLLLALNVVAGAATALVCARWLEKKHGAAAGWTLGVLVAVSPTLVFWSGSAYNVAIPQLLLVTACALGGWRGALIYGLACTMRLELALLAPAVGLVAGWPVMAGALGGLSLLPIWESAPQVTPILETLPVNLPLTGLLGPLGSLPGLLLLLLAVERKSWPFLVAALWTHGVGAAFDDYGSRHALFASICLAAALSVGSAWRRFLPLAALPLLLGGTWQVGQWYYADTEAFEATLPALSPPPEDCIEILDDPLAEGSHWQYRKAWPTGRTCWGEEAIHRALTSRSLQDRAYRMRMTYQLEPVGRLDLPGGPRLVYEVKP